ncbi:MAG TPA: response regulator [Bryobacteraceae bacterium]|nr:response regulator [Bryobacteraceae bacterium]
MPKRVLLVDDEVALARLLETYLKRLGYEVATYSDSLQAFEAFQSSAERFDLVIADMSMPRMTGEELLRKIMEMDAGVRALLCSGYPFCPEVLPPEIQKRFAFLLKPFLPRMLSQSIDELLARS